MPADAFTPIQRNTSIVTTDRNELSESAHQMTQLAFIE
jgi:hypothetical protein